MPIKALYENTQSIILSQISGKSTVQFLHADCSLNATAFEKFETVPERRTWIESVTAETPKNDPEDMQGWTYVTDYTVHPLTPKTTTETGGHFYIHAKIDKDNKLQFGAFKSIVQNQASRPTRSILGQVKDKSFAQFTHGDKYVPSLRIASKGKSEKKLLKGGKLIKSACPRYIGCFMGLGNAVVTLTVKTTKITKTKSGKILEQENFTDGPFYRKVEYYGHLWTYWASIIDNVLYMVGVPAYNGNEAGSMVYTRSMDIRKEDRETTYSKDSGRYPVPLPPTEYDLRSFFSNDGWLREDFSTAPTHPFYFAVQEAFGINSYNSFSTFNFKVEEWLEKRLDSETETILLSRPLAQINGKELTQLQHGDMYSKCSFLSRDGGIFCSSGSLTLAHGDKVTLTPSSEQFEQANYLGSGYSSGSTGYIPARTIYGILGEEVDSAQCFNVSSTGYNYRITTTGGMRPIICYSDRILSGVDVSLVCNITELTIVDDDTGGGSGGDGGDKPNTEETIEEEDIEEAETGKLGEYYDYLLNSSTESYPIKITMTPNMIDLRSYFELNPPKNKEEADTLASEVSYEFELNEDSRYLKTPQYIYNIQLQVDGIDGPFSTSYKGCNLGYRSFIADKLTSYKQETLITTTVAFDFLYGKREQKYLTESHTINRPATKEDWRLAGTTTCTALEELNETQTSKYLRLENGKSHRIKVPEKWYLLIWNEIKVEKTTQSDGSTKTTTYKKKYQRIYDNEAERDKVYDNLVAANGYSFDGSVQKRTQNNSAYVLIKEIIVSVDLQAMQDTMLWHDEATTEEEGELTITATSGNFNAELIITDITKTLP